MIKIIFPILGCVNIIKETCINCEKDYSQELRYCPNCGSKNPNFIESNQIINDFKRNIENNTYFKSKVDDEIKKFTKKIENSYQYSPKFSSTDNTGSQNDNSKASNVQNDIVISKSDKDLSASSSLESSKNSTIENKTHTPLPDASTKITCPKCGQQNEKSTNFCIKCGLDLNNIMICPKCGSISSFGKFCMGCGTPLKKLK